ncbi:rhamnosebinding lectin (SAL), partial [Achlya hypogyna]
MRANTIDTKWFPPFESVSRDSQPNLPCANMKVFPYGRQLSLTLPLLLLKADRSRAQALGSIIGGTANEGDTISFVCPSGEVIGEVLFASFGTPTGTLPNYAVGWCAAAPSEDIVESLCLGSNSCHVDVNAKTFGDPCFGTSKYLNVAVQCVDENVIGGSVSEGSEIELICPANRVIGDVTFASFGTPTGPFLDYAAGACDQPTSAATVTALCTGLPSCNIAASTSVFGDPCPGEDKYLAVQVDCIGANTIEGTVLEGSVLSLTCPAGSSISSIDFASYGTPNNYVEGDCQAKTSVAVVTAACVGHPSCDVPATNEVFDDPCPTTFKSLSVRAQCSEGPGSGVIEASANEGDSVLLACPPGKTISNVLFASYGTPTDYESPSWCNALTSINVVASECVGNSFCSVDANS